jgi:hypothetical protein
VPAIVEGNARLGFVPAAGIRLRAATAPPLAIYRHRKFRKIRRSTRRFGGRRDRRVLEGMRGCSTHGANIARHQNKSRTLKKGPARIVFVVARKSRSLPG